jgi:hypothetical protein
VQKLVELYINMACDEIYSRDPELFSQQFELGMCKYLVYRSCRRNTEDIIGHVEGMSKTEYVM